MKKILIVSEHFYPNNITGARRPTKIAKKLYELGYSVDVFARYGAENSSDICDHLFSFDTLKSGNTASASVSAKRKHGKLYEALYHLITPINILRNAKTVRKEFARLLAENSHLRETKYDAVFSSFGPLSSLLCGLYYKKTHPKTKWICDFRDPVIVKYISKPWRPLFRRYEKKACKRADAIVAVSNGYLERICKGKYAEKAFMIPNGYDVDDTVFAAEAEVSSEKMRITYVGALYGGDRDLSVLFRVIHELVCEGMLNKNKICVSYAGNEYSVMQEQAGKYDLKDVLEDCGMLSRDDCLKLQFSSQLLLLSTWNDTDEYGVFPGKFLEYMLINKPIVSITNGDLPNGEVTRVVREGNFGVAYETACDGEDYPKLKEYIKECYNEWVQKESITHSPKKEVLERYDYKTVIQRIEDLING
ncbi:MAG: glycosyltransferase [Clostridia bacterium]|nr:glycosyltransferase [Clostridia bacterium]